LLEYVNTADIKTGRMNLITRSQNIPQNVASRQVSPSGPGATAMYDLIELMFFAYRDFVGDADELLSTLGFGRAHHRVLHFVARRPGLTIAELLDILKITKQSLNRVLKELLDQGYVEARPGMKDRRQRRLFPTTRGQRLALDVALLQSRRFARVFASLPEGARAQAIAFLLAMVDPAGREKIAAMTGTSAASLPAAG
jgi:DNA-binding MarR family transcriptional regulator